MRWREVTGETIELAVDDSTRGAVRAQFVRTVPNSIYDALPRGDYRILEAYIRALRSAERLIYLESQFLWSPELVSILRAKLLDPPSDEFRVVILLPSKPNNGTDDTRGQLGVLVDADRDQRLLACTLYQPAQVDQVYVHAKIGIVDDHWLCIGSANLNEHSFYNDTEACVITTDEALVRETRLRLWREHLRRDDVDGPPHEVIDHIWKPTAEAGDHLAYLPHVSRRTRRFLGPINGLLVDG
jgi:phosphatidylserine/phosphatidylglycerophosphate/cardiolipin synthase-like enzyme